jgi:hypothetical protein
MSDKVDILYLVHNRAEFTARTLEALRVNTNWELVNELWLYDDASVDGADQILANYAGAKFPELDDARIRLVAGDFRGPVAIMSHFFNATRSPLFAKIDNDIAVPAGWLDACLNVMGEHDELDLLGIEPMQQLEVIPFGETVGRSYEATPHIGGIGLMRGRVFLKYGTPIPDGRFGFTQFQEHFPMKCGWLDPALPVVLLDRLPIEPWRSLSDKYIANGWQRRWEPYDKPEHAKIWAWL